MLYNYRELDLSFNSAAGVDFLECDNLVISSSANIRRTSSEKRLEIDLWHRGLHAIADRGMHRRDCRQAWPISAKLWISN